MRMSTVSSIPEQEPDLLGSPRCYDANGGSGSWNSDAPFPFSQKKRMRFRTCGKLCLRTHRAANRCLDGLRSRGCSTTIRRDRDSNVSAITEKLSQRNLPPSSSDGRPVGPPTCWSPTRMSSPSKLDPPLVEITELPSSYGRTQLTLMDIEPLAFHAYWEVTLRDRRAVRASLGGKSTSAAWVLRIYDVTDCHFDGMNAQSHFDVTVDLEAGSWYVKLWSSEKTYCAELGLRDAKGRFKSACRSNFVHLPRAEPSPSYRPAWLQVEGATKPVNRVSQPPSPSEGAHAERGETAAPPSPRPIPSHIGEEDIRRRYGKLTESVIPAKHPGTMRRSPERKIVPVGPLPIPIVARLRQRTAPSSSSVGGVQIARTRLSDGLPRDT